jgi:hypothetical protein|tara:strand:+ start:626 stop:1090 length:465 start_codon:yes stop_codon:yes gene_type:complete
MINEKLKLSGQVNIVLRDAAGQIKDEREIRNLVVDKGLGYIASRIADASKDVMSHMALGAGTAAAAAGQTDLVTLLGAREGLDSTSISGTSLEKVEYAASFEAGDATGAVTEAGVFNSGTAGAGDMLCRTTFPVVNKAADDTMSVTWTITLSAA